MTEITQAGFFVCHKTSNSTMQERKQCAGHMILMQDKNEFVRLAKSLGVDLGLRGHDLIFDSP